jgi:tetratricopeptide (TPR) repeat protein
VYAALVVVAAVLAWRALGRSAGGAAIGAAVLAYLVQQLFLFPLAELDPILWLLVGTLAVSRQPAAAPAIRRRRWPAAAAAAVTAVLFVTGVLGVAADRAAGQLTLAGARRAAELRPDVVRYHLLRRVAAAATGTLAGYDEAIAAADRAVDLSPHDPIAALALAQARLDRARVTGDGGDVASALQAWQQLVDHDPLCRACQYGLGLAAALAEDAERARVAWVAAADLSRAGDTRAVDALAALAAIDTSDTGDTSGSP